MKVRVICKQSCYKIVFIEKRAQSFDFIITSCIVAPTFICIETYKGNPYVTLIFSLRGDFFYSFYGKYKKKLLGFCNWLT